MLRGSQAIVLSLLAAAACTATAQDIQPAPIPHHDVVLRSDSGAMTLPAAADERVVYSTIVDVPGASWTRVVFGDVQFASGAYLRITSLHDGFHQKLDVTSIEQWQRTSAYFNGDSLFVELVAPAGVEGLARVEITGMIAGEPAFDAESICGTTDDRLPSSDPRAARVMPIGCSAWLIDDCARCMITAGHCGPSSSTVIQFNVPFSTAGGTPVNPPPQDQYPVDPTSIRTNGGAGVGNDYAYFGVFNNSSTGLHPADAQGATYTLAPGLPADGTPIRVTGYGTTSSPISPTWNQIQKTHVGPALGSSGTSLRYRPDTTGGNSGSPVINDNTGFAIGVHTHGGCVSSGTTSTNAGTSLTNTGFQNFLNDPRGVCICDNGIIAILIGFTNNRGDTLSGNLNSLVNSDNNRLSIGAVPNPNGNRFLTRTTIDADSSELNPSTGYVEVESNWSALVGSATIRAFDFDNGNWVTIGTMASSTSDTIGHFTLTSPGRFVDTDGAMRVRLQTRSSSNTDFVYNIDHVNIVLNGGNAAWCASDWNFDGEANSNDFFAFLADYQLVTNGDEPMFRDTDLVAPFGSTDTNDFFAFMDAYANGCN